MCHLYTITDGKTFDPSLREVGQITVDIIGVASSMQVVLGIGGHKQKLIAEEVLGPLDLPAISRPHFDQASDHRSGIQGIGGIASGVGRNDGTAAHSPLMIDDLIVAGRQLAIPKERTAAIIVNTANHTPRSAVDAVAFRNTSNDGARSKARIEETVTLPLTINLRAKEGIKTTSRFEGVLRISIYRVGKAVEIIVPSLGIDAITLVAGAKGEDAIRCRISIWQSSNATINGIAIIIRLVVEVISIVITRRTALPTEDTHTIDIPTAVRRNLRKNTLVGSRYNAGIGAIDPGGVDDLVASTNEHDLWDLILQIGLPQSVDGVLGAHKGYIWVDAISAQTVGRVETNIGAEAREVARMSVDEAT